MSTMHVAKRIGVILLGVLWVFSAGLYGFIRPIVFVLGSSFATMCAILWALGVVLDLPDARDFGPWFFWNFVGTLVILVSGDMLFRRK